MTEAMMVMHRTLREMPGPRAEMSAVATHWDPASHCLTVSNCGHFPQLVIRGSGRAEQLRVPGGPGLGGRASPKPTQHSIPLEPGDRVVLFSDGVVERARGNAQLGIDGVIEAALRSERATAAETVRTIHAAVLDASDQALDDDATVVCLSLS